MPLRELTWNYPTDRDRDRLLLIFAQLRCRLIALYPTQMYGRWAGMLGAGWQ